MATKIDRDKVVQAIYKKAVGYEAEEGSEEFILDDESGEIKNRKKKLNKKHYAPDIPAARVCLELFQQEIISKYDQMNESQLLEERKKLLKELSKTEKIEVEDKDDDEEK